MLFPEKEITLKNGRKALLCSPSPDMAPQMLKYLKETCGETHFLMRTPEECDMSLDAERAFLQYILDSPDAVMILCLVDGKIAGNCQIARKNRIKTAHRGSVAIALYREFWGLGIGTAMFREMIDLAENWGLLQLELEVIDGNTRAIGLYKKMGFQTVAATPNAIRLPDGTMLKEFLMVKSLSI